MMSLAIRKPMKKKPVLLRVVHANEVSMAVANVEIDTYEQLLALSQSLNIGLGETIEFLLQHAQLLNMRPQAW